MKTIYTNYLFNKQILVAEKEKVDTEEMVDTLAALLKGFSISIVNGAELASKEVAAYVQSKFYGEASLASFYRNFPHSIYGLSSAQAEIDQALHYFNTYGCGNFDEAGHSVFERELIERFEVDYDNIKFFNILTEEEATAAIERAYNDLCASTREWNLDQLNFATTWVEDHKEDLNILRPILSKSNLCCIMTLLYARDNLDTTRYRTILNITDTKKLVDRVATKDGNKFYLSTKGKKYITNFIRLHCNVTALELDKVIQQRKFWKGLLHQLHFKPNCTFEQDFVEAVFDDSYKSEMSMVEKFMNADSPVAAFSLMNQKYGTSFALRHLNYCLSRTTSMKQVDGIFSVVEDANPIVLLQLLNKFSETTNNKEPRIFSFNANKVKVKHKETPKEVEARQSVLSKKVRAYAYDKILELVRKHYQSAHAYNKVYINPDMQKIALPLDNTTSGSGLGVLPSGSRVKIPYDTVRLFTYWEKVNDIDLSCYALTKNGDTVARHNWQSVGRWNYGETPIAFSGDQTSGFHGGSEFFDVDIPLYKKTYPKARYIVCSNNVYSSKNFDEVFCIAGYMDRHTLDGGAIYDPKTITTQFAITAKSTYATLFMIDLETNEMIWLNVAPASKSRVVNGNELELVLKYVKVVELLNVSNLYSWLSAEQVDSPDDADVIISDDPKDERDGKDVIHSRDCDRLLKDLNR